MIPTPFLPWMIAFLTISLIFVVLATFLFCILGESYNSHRAKIERRGNLQQARNLIKLIPLNYLETNPVILVDKKTQISRFLLNDLKSNKKIKFETNDQNLPNYIYHGVRPLIAPSGCNKTPALDLVSD